MSTSLGPGIHKISADAYHRDPCETPSLSSSIVSILCSSSPAHARVAHPRLVDEVERDEKEHFDLGTAAHAILLEGTSDIVEVVDAKDWRRKDAQAARDAAHEAGKTPLLIAKWERLQEMIESAKGRLDAIDARPALLVDGKPEQTIVWEEDGVLCRALCDWLHDDYSAIDDLKTTSRSANPEQWSRSVFSIGGDIQAAFYLRGLRALTGCDAEFRFIVAETFPPFALAVLSPGPDVLALADAKVDYALGVWRRCLETGEWPAYPTRVCHIDLPPWLEPQWMERESREAAAA